MNIESKEFWEKVKQEYKPKGQYELCNNSNTFRQQWDFNDELIKIIGSDFLKDCKITGVHIGNCWLFLRASNPVEIRKQFIDYCIQKYSK